MRLTKFIIFKLLKFNIFNKILFKLSSIFYHNKNDILKINYFKKKFIVLNKSLDSQNNLCLFNNLFSSKSIDTISYYIFILNIFKFNGFKPAIFSSFKFFSLLKYLDILSLPPLLSYNKFLSSETFSFKSIKEIKKYKWKKISCGIFALSTTLKELKTEDFSLGNPRHLKILKKNLFKSIDHVDSFLNFLKENKVGAAVFSDPGYVGQGEMFEILTNKNIPCYQFYMSIDDNKIIFKKYLKNNQKDHFDKISDKKWKYLLKKNINKNQLKNSLNKIKQIYLKNNWFPSVGTTRSENLFSKKEIFKLLKLDVKKPTAVIFNHIFWDGTFFYGEDTFPTYRDWFLETIKVANKNRNLNWIIKPHPANKVQNLRNGVKNEVTEEEKIIKKTFGKIPENFKILKYNNKINSWSLYQFLDYCLTIRGTPGIESALFGSETILCGTGRYEKRGFSKYFKNKRVYLDYLLKLKKHPKKNYKVIKNALLYADNVFFKKPLKLDAISIKYKKNQNADMDLKVKFYSIKDFLAKDDIIKITSWINSKEMEFYSKN